MVSNFPERILVEIGLGLTKAQSKFAPLTPEQSAAWDTVDAQVKAIKAKGGEIQIPHEIEA